MPACAGMMGWAIVRATRRTGYPASAPEGKGNLIFDDSFTAADDADTSPPTPAHVR
jgi:hypothetical protein